MMYIVLAACASAALTLVLKWFRDPKGTRYGLLLGNYLTCALIAFIQMPGKDRFYSAAPSTRLMSLISGLLYVVSLVTLQSSVRLNGAALSSAFSKLGITIPLLMSFLLFGETPTWYQAAGLLISLAAIAVLNFGSRDADGGREKQGRAALTILLLTLLTCGGSEGMAKVFERLGDPREDTRYFFFLFLTASLLTAALAVAEMRKNGKRIRPGELAAGVLAGIPNYFSSYFLLKALNSLPALLVYPSFSVGTILLVMGTGALLFGERLTRRQWAGLSLILAALVLLNL